MLAFLRAFVLLPGVQPAAPSPPPASGQDVVIAELGIPGVADSRAFVEATYARNQASPNVPPPDQSFVCSPRLKALFDAYDS